MSTILNFGELAVATALATATATALHWFFLRAAFQLMRPAAVRSEAPRLELANGTVALARAYARHR